MKMDNNGKLTTFDKNCKSITSDRKTSEFVNIGSWSLWSGICCSVKKRSAWELSCSQLSVFVDAINQPTSVDNRTVQSRNDAVEKQLSDRNFRAVDIYSDGNCFYGAISVFLHGSQAQHNKIRQNVAGHMLIHGKNIFQYVRLVVDDISIKKHADSIGTASVWAG